MFFQGHDAPVGFLPFGSGAWRGLGGHASAARLAKARYRTHANDRLPACDPPAAIIGHRTRAMSELHRVTIDPAQCGGQPCLRGLRIRVTDVLDLLAAGASREEILADHPLLEAGDITAALEYAARQSDHPVLHVA